MPAAELLKRMISSFFIITTGIITSMYVYCLILIPDASFTLTDIGRILLMAAASDLPFILFFSRRELDKKQMLIRKIIHFSVLSAILLYFALLWDWVSPGDAKEIAVFFLLVLLVYAAVSLVNRYKDRKLSDKLNERLKLRYRS